MFPLRSLSSQFQRGLWCIVLLLLVGNLWSVQAQSLPVIMPQNAADLREIARLGDGNIRSAQVSPDGKWLAVASSLGVVMYDTSDFSQPPRLLAADYPIAQVAFSPDSQWIVGLTEFSYGINVFLMWTIDTDHRPLQVVLPQEPRQAVFSSQGSWLAILVGNTSVYVYAPGQTTPKYIMATDDEEYLERAFFSPDDRILVAQSYTGAWLWEMAAGEALSFSTGTRLYAFHPDGQQMATYDRDRRLRVWDITDLENVVNIAAPRVRMSDGYAIEYTPDGSWLITTGEDGVRVWETTDYTLVDYRSDIKQDYDALFKPAFSPDSRWVAFLSESVHIWDTAKQTMVQHFGERYRPVAVHFIPESNTVAVFYRTYSSSVNDYLAEIGLYDVVSGKQIRHYTQDVPQFPYYLGVPPHTEALWLFGKMSVSTRLMNLLSNEMLLQIDGHTTQVSDVAFSPDGKTLASAGYDEVGIWDIATLRQKAFYERNRAEYGKVAFYDDSVLDALGYDGFEQLDIRTGETVTHIVPSGIISFVVSPDGLLVATSLDYIMLEIWNTVTQTPTVRYESDLYPALFSPDNQYLLMYYADVFKLFDIERQDFVLELKRSSSDGLTFAFTPDSQQFAFFSAETGTIAFWDIAEEKIVRELSLSELDKLRDIVFNPDGTVLAASYKDEMVLWDVADDTEIARVQVDTIGINRMKFSPDGTLIATAGEDGTVRLWGIRQ